MGRAGEAQAHNEAMGQYCSIGPNPSAAPAPATELPEELVEEILLRFPPSEPASLVRAALVCKQWCRLVSVPRFRRRFREFHRTPPMAGFLCSGLGRDGVEAARFVPTASAFRSPLPDLRHCHTIDARHGRVLLQCPGREAPSETETAALVVWNTISDERRELPVPIWWCHVTRWRSSWNAAVLRATAGAASGGGPCDNGLDCQRGPFVVVFVHSQCVHDLFTSTYSSETGTWIDRIFPLHPTHYVPITLSLPCAHVGNALYFASEASNTALKYDLCLHKPSVIFIPSVHSLVFPYVFTTMEDGRLRYTVIERSTLYMWSRVEKGPGVDARRWVPNDGWKQDRVIELKMLLLSNAIWALPSLVGFADGAGVLFLKADNVHFTLDINTSKVKKVSKDITVDKALPYMSFYTTPAQTCGGAGGQSPARQRA